MRQPRERARRPARAAGRQPRRGRAPGGVGAAARARPPARGDRRGARLLRAAHARLPGRARRRRARRARRARGAARAISSCALRAEVRGERLALDFAGSAPQHAGNLNCPLAVTASACLFAVRVLTDPDIPPTAGAYRPVEVRAPEGSVLNARAGRGGRGGQRRDLLARRRPRAERVRPRPGPGHDEQPVASATSASPTTRRSAAGRAPARTPTARARVHVAMSNTLNTPVEALERDFPLRVIEYSLRRGSGGAGRRRGGDGVVRELKALSEMSFSLIAERRRHGPRGAARRRRRAPGPRPARRRRAARQGDGNARCRLAAAHRDPRWGRIRRCRGN